MTRPPRRIRGAAYYRVSLAKNADSTDVQREHVHEYCDKWGLELLAEYEETVSASKGRKRQALEACVSAAEQGQFDLVVVRHSSRAFRDVEEALATTKRLTAVAVGLVDVTEPPDVPDTPSHRLVRTVQWGVNRYEADTIGERLRDKQQYLLSQGKWPGGPTPLGLKWSRDRKAFDVEPEEAQTVRRVFELYVEAAGSVRGTAVRLNQEGLVGKRGGAFSPYTVTSIIGNPIYRGEFRWSGKLHKLDYEALDNLVPRDLVLEATRLRQARRGLPKPRKRVGSLFQGILRCGQCGGGMTYKASRLQHKGGENRRVGYYICVLHIVHACERKRMVRDDWLCEQVVGGLGDALRQYADNLPSPEHDTHRIAELRERHGRLLDAYEAGLMTWADFSRRAGAVQAELEQEERKLAAVPLTDAEIKAAARELEQQWGEWDYGARRRFLLTFVESITVPADLSSVEIALREA